MKNRFTLIMLCVVSRGVSGRGETIRKDNEYTFQNALLNRMHYALLSVETFIFQVTKGLNINFIIF